MNRPFFHAFRAAAALTLVLAYVSCSNQAEGERCERDNGDDDCQEGLVCTPSTKLGGSADICCPPGDSSDVAECQPNNGGTSSSASTGGGGAGGTSSSASTGGGGGGGGSTSSASSSDASSSASGSGSSSSGSSSSSAASSSTGGM